MSPPVITGSRRIDNRVAIPCSCDTVPFCKNGNSICNLSTKNEWGLILGFTSKAKITILDQERQPEDVTAEKLPKDVYKTVTATSEEKTAEHKQGIENAFDENLDTFWHAQWGDAGKLKNHPNGISVEMTLKEAKEIAKLTYIPKAGDTGTVGNYIIEAATGTMPNFSTPQGIIFSKIPTCRNSILCSSRYGIVRQRVIR